MSAIERTVEQIAPCSCPVFIAGAPGSGKHALALRLYELSARMDRSFLELTCATASGEAFQRGSRLLACGSLYLDDIADLQPQHQDALLATYFTASADWTKLPRLLVGCCEEAPESLRGNVIHEALYDCLTAVTIRLPALRQRGEDVLQLAQYFVSSYADVFGRPQPTIDDEVARFFLEYPWPGNVDELEAACKTMVALGDARSAIAALRASALHSGNGNHRRNQSLKHAARIASQQAERALIAEVLQQTGGNRKQAAQRLQISYKALLYKLKQNSLSVPPLASAEEGEAI